jgi:hypothetical protein
VSAEPVKCVHRFVVAVDGEPHKMVVSRGPLKVAARYDGRTVEFWSESGGASFRPRERWFQVFGTGHPIPATATYWGTTERTDEGLVWHLSEVFPEAAGQQPGEASR